MRVISDSHFFCSGIQIGISSEKGRAAFFADVILVQQTPGNAFRIAAAAAGRDSGDLIVKDPITGTGSRDISPLMEIFLVGMDPHIIIDIGVTNLYQAFFIDAFADNVVTATGPVTGMLDGNHQMTLFQGSSG